MLLNPSYKYIGLDFETTGLDIEKDEPIQIGIVQIDYTGKVIKEYSSLIKPQRDLNELKTIVGFITGLNIEGLASAPTPEEVNSEITEFFGDNTVLIGHNIAFDEQFLKKFFPECTYTASIDTFPLAQTMLHYQSSYALEILMKNPAIAKANGEAENFHDALFDTQNAIRLFLFILEKIYRLAQNYPVLNYYLNQESFTLHNYLAEHKETKLPVIREIPKLNKIMPNHTQAQATTETINTDELEHGKRYYVGHLSLKRFLEKCLGQKNIIIAFSNAQKLEIAKNILNDMGLKNLGFLKEEQIIDYDKFAKLMSKETHTQGETNFILKYYSHLDQGLGILDLNGKTDFQVYYSIKNSKNQTKYPIVLATHQGLFYHMQEGDSIYKDHEIFFMDAERRYKSYNMFLSRGLDLYYVLNFVETIIYKQELEAERNHSPIDHNDPLHTFANSFQIFIAQVFMESKPYFVKTSVDQIQVDPLVTNSNFYKSQILRGHLKEHFEEVEKTCPVEDLKVLQKHMDHMDHIFNTLMNIQKKATNDDYYFVYNEATKYTSWPEFMDIFTTSVYFFSNSDTKAIMLYPDEIKQATIPTIAIKLYDRIINYIRKPSEKKSYFIVSTRKEESKQMFDAFYKEGLHNEYRLLIENITGGVGKNIAKAKEANRKIIIGGYAFLLSVYASKIPLDEIIVFNIRGANEQSILDDIQRYAPH